MKASKFLKFGCVGVLLLVIAGVVFFILLIKGFGEIQSEAEAAADRYFQALVAKDWDKTDDMYGPEFFQNTPKKEWHKMRDRLEKKFGKYQSRQSQGFRFRKYYGTGGGYLTAVITYRVQYENGIATEVITLRRKIGETQLKLIGHHINSNMLLKPDE